MSGVSNSAMAISVYLSASKNEQAQVARYVGGDSRVKQTVSSFQGSAATLGSSQAILANYKALQVLTGAYNMTGQLNRRAILSDLMTQSADSPTSLVQKSANTDYLHFARATQDRPTQTASLGNAGTLSLSTTGAAASTLTMSNIAWSGSAPTAASPAVQWSFVLNDGTAAASVAATLNAASKANGGSGGYTVGASGTVTSPPGQPVVASSTDKNGNTTYSLPVATGKGGAVTRRVDVVSVRVAAGAATASAANAATATVTATGQMRALTGAMTAAGFDATLSATGQLAVIAPATTGLNTLSPAFATPIATASAHTVDPGGRLVLGNAGKELAAGQVLMDGQSVIGTVKSVDAFGTVTLTAAATATPAAGDAISLATALSFSNVGTTLTAKSAVAAGATTIALGSAGIGLRPGQAVSVHGVTIGTIASVDAHGNATLLAGSKTAVAGGATLIVSPAVSAAPTHALSDAKNVASIVSSYETSCYETSMGQQYTGLDDALYYSRTMGSITSISQLMSNSRLLSVVTTSLGMGSYFGALDYSQQVRILTSKVNLHQMTTPDGIKKTSMQYLINQSANTTTQPTGIAALYSSDSMSTQNMFGLANGIQAKPTTTTSPTNPVLGLFL